MYNRGERECTCVCCPLQVVEVVVVEVVVVRVVVAVVKVQVVDRVREEEKK